MVHHLKRHARSYKYAAKGVQYTLTSQVNIWVQILATISVLIIAHFLDFPLEHLAILMLTIGFVIVTELLNTAIEELVNLVSPQQHPQAGIIKDIAAGAVLVAALTSVIIGAALFYVNWAN